MNYYVYKHMTNSGEIFYIGKGTGKRCYNLTARSLYHKRISKKHGCIVSIISQNLSEEQAMLLESKLIKKYKNIGLCKANFTNGGEGRSGIKHSEITINKMRISKLGKSSGMLGKTHKTESNNLRSESLRKSNKVFRKKIKCITTGKIYQSLSDACLKLGLAGTSNLSKVLKGTRSHINGLKFEYVVNNG